MSQAGRGGVIRRGYSGGHATDCADAARAPWIAEAAAEGEVRGRARVPLRSLLRAGLAPKVLAWSVAAGLAFGIIPLMGASTLLCVAAGSAFRLNQAAMQAANWAASPLQLALLIPFIRLGERLFRAPALSPSMLRSALEAGAWEALGRLGTSLWHAGVAWLVVVPLPAALLAWTLTPLLRVLAGAFRRPEAPPRREG